MQHQASLDSLKNIPIQATGVIQCTLYTTLCKGNSQAIAFNPDIKAKLLAVFQRAQKSPAIHLASPGSCWCRWDLISSVPEDLQSLLYSVLKEDQNLKEGNNIFKAHLHFSPQGYDEKPSIPS